MNDRMTRVFKESPHPDEKQRQQLSQELGLSARQVKFWFQNRRTQIKVMLFYKQTDPTDPEMHLANLRFK